MTDEIKKEIVNEDELPLGQEVILSEEDPLPVQSPMGKKDLFVGARVKVVNFVQPVDPRNSFDWNGLIGKITAKHVHETVTLYEVMFERVKVPFARPDIATGKLQRGYVLKNARNIFDDTFLQIVG